MSRDSTVASILLFLETRIRRHRHEGEFDLDLVSACLIALFSVFTLLTFLALIMDLITRLFPARDGQVDPAIVAAISTTVASLLPGARVVRIEEEK
jgi:hypothetical protein